jgi:hypothetical protein
MINDWLFYRHRKICSLPLLQFPELIVATVTVPLLDIGAVICTGGRNIKAFAAVFGRDEVITTPLWNQHP